MKRLWPVVVAALFAACPSVETPARASLSSYSVTVHGVFLRSGQTRTPLDVESRCQKAWGGEVPDRVRGTRDCRYVIPLGSVEFDVEATALDARGQPLTDYVGLASFRILPGDLTGSLEARQAQVAAGRLTATVTAMHQYGPVRVWVEDSPPRPTYAEGEVPVDDGGARTWATGASPIIYFEEQTLQSLQEPDDFDNRSSPFVGEFVSVGKNPESGALLTQSCADDPLRDGQPAMLVVTGLDPAGFFVTDVSACRLIEKTRDAAGSTQVRTPEPKEPCLVDLADGGVAPIEDSGVDAGVCEVSRLDCAARSDCRSYLPATFASMFVYNYNFPDGLSEGDLLFTLAGSIQEFTSTTQMVFPSWSIAESMRLLPLEERGKWLSAVKPWVIGGRTCGWDDTQAPFLTDQLCGHNRRNLKMESLESALVTVRQVRFPEVFAQCDFNGDGTVPFFCETKAASGEWVWASCDFDNVEPEEDRVERQCNQDCVVGAGDYRGRVCSERATFKGFGQFVVELAPAGPAWAGLDETLPARMRTVTAPGGGAAVRAATFGPGVGVALVCDAPAHFRVGDDGATAEAGDPRLARGEVRRLTPGAGETQVSFIAEAGDARCWVGENSGGRINLITADALPQLNVDCREDDADADAAEQCRALRAATFDVTGHLRHVQPARPRWVVLPRGPDDVCCHPGPGLSCPRPISECAP